ncbi:hypothetical protein ACFPA1_19800 [Neobacillus sp. GCM10023253]|uniref:hypothetical protein n=1 Tax=Neobacillus sp. GCM10023253 TaxID=3252644 RepID=UPI003621DB39
MEGNSKNLITFITEQEGKDIEAILMDEVTGTVGFSFMSYIKSSKVHIQSGRITVSEPKTGKYFCLPMSDIKQICDESCGPYDLALTIEYNNGYSIFIQIFES